MKKKKNTDFTNKLKEHNLMQDLFLGDLNLEAYIMYDVW